MRKILFFIHDLGQGGAEKVLVNLVNNLDLTKFDITVMALFGGGVNEQFLRPEIHYKSIFTKIIPGNSHVLKLFSPKFLHRCFIREKYDVEISYLEGPSARIISGCSQASTKLISWIHVEQHTMKTLAYAFRSKEEAVKCYNRFDKMIYVSKYVEVDFNSILDYKGDSAVLYNTVETDEILKKSREEVTEIVKDEKINLVAVGTLKENKGYERLLRIIRRFVDEKYKVRLYILGIGPLQQELEQYVKDNQLEDFVIFLGYQTNPYKYVAKCDLFVCASFAEGFSTATTEALIVGTPVCTVDVSGIKEMLGEHNEYGIVVENDEENLYIAIKDFLDYPEKLEYYRQKAFERGKKFSTKNTVQAVEMMLENISGKRNV